MEEKIKKVILSFVDDLELQEIKSESEKIKGLFLYSVVETSLHCIVSVF